VLDKEQISLDKATQIAQIRYPKAQLRWLETPAGTQGVFKITLYQQGEPSRRFPKTMVWIDQYSGKILAIRDPKRQTAGDIFWTWLHPLHSGEIAGLTGRIIIFISGLLPLMLYVTGLIRWRQKCAAKRAMVKKIPKCID
jgi:uncharacterized iron-regulated membrane protein